MKSKMQLKNVAMICFCIIATLGLSFCLFAGKLMAKDTQYTTGDWTYVLNYGYDGSADAAPNEITLVAYSGTASKPTFPKSFEIDSKTYPVTGIGNECFKGNKKFTEVNIPDYIKYIGYGAFADCTSIISVTVGSGLETWGGTGYYNAYHDRIEGTSAAFQGCTALANLVLEDGISSVGAYTFYGCNHLTSVTIPASAKFVGIGAFQECTKLTKVSVGNGSIGADAFRGCNVLSSLTLGTITEINNAAFAGCVMLSEVKLPDTLTLIGNEAFANCTTLGSIVIPDKVTTIGYAAFYKCTKLASVVLGSSVKTWNNTEYYNDYHNRELVNAAFEQCTSLKSLTVKKGTQAIGKYAFAQCTLLPTVDLPSTVKEVGYAAFYNCTDITSANVYGTVGDSAFENDAKLVNLSLANAESIGDRAFKNAGEFTTLVIPEAVTYIGNEAFFNCKGIKEVIIPDQVKTIGCFAFYKCIGIKNVVIGKSVENWAVSGYYNDIYNRSESNAAFSGCEGIETVTIKSGVSCIGSRAFIDCTSLKSVCVPITVETIGFAAFQNCTSMTSAEIHYGEIGDYAFYGCSAMTDMKLYNITKIGYQAFKKCTVLNTVELPATITSIGSEAFAYTSIKAFVVPNAVQEMGALVCANCEKLELAVIGSAVSTWGHSEYNNEYVNRYEANMIFFNDTALKNVYFCDGISALGSHMFYGCSGLQNVYLPTTITSYGDKCFSTVDENSVNLCVMEGSKQKEYAEENSYQAKVVKDISTSNITLSQTNYVYTGESCTPAVTVECGGAKLVEGKDYLLYYYNNIDVGAATVFVVGCGEYGSTNNTIFTISEKAMNAQSFTVELKKTSYPYTGAEIVPDLEVKDGAVVLAEGKDYYISYSDNVNVGTVEATIIGLGNYSGTITTSFTITTRDISQCTMTMPEILCIYTGKAIVPQITLKSGEVELKADKDYKLTCENNITAGTASYTVTGMGNYTGTITGTFGIGKLDLSMAKVRTKLNNFYYTGAAVKPEFIVEVNDIALTLGKDYTVEYSDNVEVGVAKAVITGVENCEGRVSVSFEIKPMNLANCTVKVEDVEFTGKAAEPKVTVSFDGTTLVEGVSYKVEYKNNTAVGTGTVIITGLGSIEGKVEKSFSIYVKVAKVTGVKATAKKKSATITWKKVTGATKYQVSQYNPTTKKWTVKTVKTNKLTVKKLKSKKTYKFKVRAVKTIAKKDYYGSYSKTVSAKIK